MGHIAIQLLLVWAIGCCWNVAAQYGFQIPDPTVPDFDSYNTISQGAFVNIIWLVNSTWQPTINSETLLDPNGNVSLWLTSFLGTGYTQCLTPSVHSSDGGSWAYNVSLSDDDIDSNAGKFVYRLKPTVGSQNSPYSTTEDECPSRGFMIKKASDVAAAAASSSAAVAASVSHAAAESRSEAAAAAASSASAASAASTSAASASASQASSTPGLASAGSPKSSGPGSVATGTGSTATGTIFLPSLTAIPTPADSTFTTTGTAAAAVSTSSQASNSGLSEGAKAGIAIGVIALVPLGVIALLLFLRHRKANALPQQPLPPSAAMAHKDYAEHIQQSAPQRQDPRQYAVPPPQGFPRPDPRAAELGEHVGYHGGAELPNPHGYGYGADVS
ncbi:hypothetical protein K432DRAFT_410300 [Lepidopterella palustris CBS 459.81]|uniref:Mid2 domain-containing protein n=1 Tax=Lepidopterella palustris CBS 459.81 TaxID=1314670 RepID=A0A8E2J922_9PEZI|nr:hypothetical protein K432DRAFT_410300 [Lepidopterella palustris CBS 459.81]